MAIGHLDTKEENKPNSIKEGEKIIGENSNPSQGKNGKPQKINQKGGESISGEVEFRDEIKPALKKASLKNARPGIPGTSDTIENKLKTSASKNTKAVVKKPLVNTTTKLVFQLRFHTEYGESLFISANHKLFGNGEVSNALPMQYLNEELWVVSVDIHSLSIPPGGIQYNYILKHEDGICVYDWGEDKKIMPGFFKFEEVLIADSWNHAGYFDNAFYTEPFQNVLLKNNFTETKIKLPKNYTHIFKVKAPLLKKGETVCLLGSAKELHKWNEEKPIILSRSGDQDYHSVALNLSNTDLPLQYKYGVYDTVNKRFLRYENGNNRVFFHAHAAAKNKLTIVNDGFIVLPDNTWKGAGVSVPVFSLRSQQSWGVGEFTDLKLLVDWAKKTGLQLIQILPVNDTNATGTWADSYPYAAISAFALHPMYLNLERMAGESAGYILEDAKKEKALLNKKPAVDYVAVNQLKWKLIEAIYPLQKKSVFSSAAYKVFYQNNKHWLMPYAAFCYYRDLYGTSDFNNWPSNKKYHSKDVAELFKNKSTALKVLLHCFVQFHLHVQLQDAAAYAHEKGIIIKGDIPIGIYRYGADAWQHKELFHMDMQAGAPPDDFAVKGQNWCFPTYNWQKMEADHFTWWRMRFKQMSYYFDAFRIDHILGFFRIWSIPMDSVEGIMGHFEPCIPVHIHEFHERNISFDYNRFTKPFITEQVLNDLAGKEAENFKQNYLLEGDDGNYTLRKEFSTQRKIEAWFSALETNEQNDGVKQKLFDLVSNVILFEVEKSGMQKFHFRFAVDTTKSFQYLHQDTQTQLRELYNDYFFRRQDNFWKIEAMKKLPALKRSTNMLICGEDLGLVPGSVPDVMHRLGLLSLEIQRMPKQSNREFFHPNDAPYLSVVTPSTHDMSTIRGWWEEDRTKTQRFFNNELGKWGDAPYFCEPWINQTIFTQHLYSPAMWSIFQVQDILGMSKKLRRENPHEERINVPAIQKHYWKYRMHLFLEDLLNEDEFNNELKESIRVCHRIAAIED